jgi:phage tail-like protein
MAEERLPDPFHIFRFRVEFSEGSSNVPLCRGQFSDCTGLEATMEPQVIKEGGRNYGALQRSGPVTFGTVILKRGITQGQHLWRWFEFVTLQNAYAYRLTATISLLDSANEALLQWELSNVLPIKFKLPDFNAKATEVGIEEIHLAHEGLKLVKPTGGAA